MLPLRPPPGRLRRNLCPKSVTRAPRCVRRLLESPLLARDPSRVGRPLVTHPVRLLWNRPMRPRLTLLRKPLPVVKTVATRLWMLRVEQCRRPSTLTTRVLRPSRHRAAVLRLELNREKVRPLWQSVRLRWRALEIRPTVPIRVLLLI